MTLASQLVALAALWVSKLSLDAPGRTRDGNGAPSRASGSASAAVAWPGGCCRRGDHREPPSLGGASPFQHLSCASVTRTPDTGTCASHRRFA